GGGQSLFRRARSPNVCAKTFFARPFQGQLGVSNTSAEMRGSFSPHVGRMHQTPKVSPAVAAGVTSAFENLVILLTCWKLGNKSAWATLSSLCDRSGGASIAWPVIQFWGSWLGTVKRERREADRKLVAGCYLCDRGCNVKPHAGNQSGAGRCNG